MEDYFPISEELIRSAKCFWEPRYGRKLSDEEAREIIRNIESFIDVLWTAEEMKCRGHGAPITASTVDDPLETDPGKGVSP